MLSYLFPIFYIVAVIILLWQAFRVMGKGFLDDKSVPSGDSKPNKLKGDRTGRLTIHPELLDQEGRITDEELLTVRFSGEIDPPKSAETSSE